MKTLKRVEDVVMRTPCQGCIKVKQDPITKEDISLYFDSTLRRLCDECGTTWVLDFLAISGERVWIKQQSASNPVKAAKSEGL